NPALMWIDRRLCFERELACDDGVLEWTHAPAVYATALVSLAERAKNRRAAATLSLGAWGRRSELGRRVESILNGGNRMSPRRAKIAAGAIGVTLLGVAAGLSRTPHFVSFNEGMTHGAVAERPVPMPPSVAVPEYRPAMFRFDGAAHQKLLKADMPSGATIQPAQTPNQKKTNRAHKSKASAKPLPAVEQVKQATTRTQRWVVLTTFSVPQTNASSGTRPAMPVRPAMMLTVDGEHAIAAVPTGDGWLVIQL
ncbi:MAG: hypothetical protein JOZ33_09215, partial [Acidobacteriaceae bacterium]|nr:hypothetical protein [Acidobacteriaceae bacterium]